MEVQSDRVTAAAPMVSLRPPVSPSRLVPPHRAVGSPVQAKISVRDLDFYYGHRQALFHVGLTVRSHSVTAFIGPSGCGKSTLLRCLNRMNDLVESARAVGRVELDGVDIYEAAIDVTDLRKRVGMVFQKSNPFPKSIYDNVAYGPRLHGTKDKRSLDELVQHSLQGAGLWDEVKDRLQHSAVGLSGGQQQRLCIARALAVQPEVILMDEPCSALDPIATGKIEELIYSLKETYTVVIVTHNMQQAARVSDQCGFFLMGELVEFGDTKTIFTTPRDKRTEDYITGRFG